MSIRVFVGTDPRMQRSDLVLEYSIRKHASEPVDITFMRAGEPPLWDGWVSSPKLPYMASAKQWATGFTCFRWVIPELCDYQGYAIYLDTDMVVLADIAELYGYRQEGRWRGSGSSVLVIDCAAPTRVPKIASLKKRICTTRELQQLVPFSGGVPMAWNCFDRLPNGAKLLHFTNMRTQPWHPWPERFRYGRHPSRACQALWDQYEKEAVEWQQHSTRTSAPIPSTA